MVTTRSQDRADASSPATVNKRRRFSSEDADTSFVVEVPGREAEDVKAHMPLVETESDDEAAPEIVSIKDADQQVRALPNRSLGRAGNKRMRITKDLQERKSAESTDADQVTASSSSQPASSVETPREVLQVPLGESTASDTRVQHIEDSEVIASEHPVQVLDSSGKVPAQNEPLQSLENLAGDANQNKTEGPEQRVEVATTPIITDPDAATSRNLHLDLAPEAPPDVVQEPRSTPQTISVAHHDPVPAEATQLSKTETSQPILLDPPMSQPAEMDTTPSSPPDETTALQKQADPATPARTERIAQTPQSTASGIITPVWQIRTHETPIGSITSPSTQTKTKPADPSRSRPGPKLALQHQQMLNSKRKPTSLQQYRDGLLSRHPRTARWGPPVFRNTKFVGP